MENKPQSHVAAPSGNDPNTSRKAIPKDQIDPSKNTMEYARDYKRVLKAIAPWLLIIIALDVARLSLDRADVGNVSPLTSEGRAFWIVILSVLVLTYVVLLPYYRRPLRVLRDIQRFHPNSFLCLIPMGVRSSVISVNKEHLIFWNVEGRRGVQAFALPVSDIVLHKAAVRYSAAYTKEGIAIRRLSDQNYQFDFIPQKQQFGFFTFHSYRADEIDKVLLTLQTWTGR